jgi:O-antigen/teichoic acid export membrane protein
MTMIQFGALCFGLVIGWVTYRTLRRREGTAALSDIATVIGAVGGAAVTTLFKLPDLFAAYSIGLAIGFFLYFIIGLVVGGKESAKGWMGE